MYICYGNRFITLSLHKTTQLDNLRCSEASQNSAFIRPPFINVSKCTWALTERTRYCMFACTSVLACLWLLMFIWLANLRSKCTLCPLTTHPVIHIECVHNSFGKCRMSYRSGANTRTIIIHICRTKPMLEHHSCFCCS